MPLTEIYRKHWLQLSELNEAIIRYLFAVLEIKAKIVTASQLGIDYKLPDSGNKDDNSATGLIIQMCHKLNSDSYLHGKHGHDYLDKCMLDSYNIISYFQDFQHPVYKQCYKPFMPEMSILDLLFNCGVQSREIIRQCGKYT
jgi:hypothetical protein